MPALSSKTTGDQIIAMFGSECKHKTFIITGSNTGLGFETARLIASQPDTQIIIASRNSDKGRAAVLKITTQFPHAKVDFLELDLSSLQSIRKFSLAFLAKYKSLNVLINNAGIMACPLSFTVDNFETQFGVCHIGHFYLTQLLLPILITSATKITPSRVVNLSSVAHFMLAPSCGILFDDIRGDQSYNAWERYGQAKLANVVHATELNRRYAAQNVIGISLHPGAIVQTELKRHIDFWSILNVIYRVFTRWSALKQKNTQEGVSTTLVASLDPGVVPGGYYYDCNVSVGGVGMHPKAVDPAIALKLWNYSEDAIATAVAKLPAAE